MADDIRVVAEARRFITPSADATRSRCAADWAERGIELLSRWAGILSFVGAVAGIGWLIF